MRTEAFDIGIKLAAARNGIEGQAVGVRHIETEGVPLRIPG
jgi:hypothetical protein